MMFKDRDCKGIQVEVMCLYFIWSSKCGYKYIIINSTQSKHYENIQRDKLKSAMNKSRWNPKTCSNNLQKDKKEKTEQQELKETNRK